MRSLMWFTIGFASACAAGAWIFRGMELLILAVVSIAAEIGLAIAARHRKKLLPAAVVLAGMAVGCLWFAGFQSRVLNPAAQLDGRTIPIKVEADSYGWDTEYGTAVKGRLEAGGKTFRVQLYLNEKLEIRPGDRVVTSARMRMTDMGGSKAPTFHRGNGIFLLAYQKEDAQLIPGEPGLRHLPVVLRKGCLDRIDRFFPEDTRGFAKALLLGDREGLTYQNRTDFSVTGISHVVAVSGLHLSMLFAAVYTLAGKRRFSTLVLGVPCALLFAAMVGFTPSVTRSAIMLTLFMLAMALNREYDPPTALSFAVVSMLLGNPLIITSVGFQMSVSSVAGIFLFYRPVRGWIWKQIPGTDRQTIRKPARWLTASVSVTVSATVLSAPLAAYYFGGYSLVGILTNLLVLPVVGVIFCGTFLICICGEIMPLLSGAAAWLISILIRYVLGVSHLLGKVPIAAVYTASPYTVIWLVFLYCLILHLIFGKFRRPILAGCLAVVGLGAALCCAYLEPLLDSYRVSALDVGQGQCVLLQSGGNTFLVDCGGDYDEETADLAAETLLSMGISRIDGLIISHYDRDHCGGAEYLAQRIKIDRAYLPVPREPGPLSDRVIRGLSGTEIIWMEEDMELRFGESQIRIFAPRPGNSDNESCAAVLFQRGKYDTLITGDLPASRELWLLENQELPDLEVLVVGHHGSKTSTCQELLDQCAPDVAMISAGDGNPYGHPALPVLERLEQAGCRILRTDQMGTITYRR